MEKNKIIGISAVIVVVFLGVFFMSGNSTIKSQDIVDCNVGSYSATEYQQNMMEKQGTGISKIVVEKTKYNCEATFFYDKPKLVLGTEVFSFTAKYSFVCINSLVKRNETSDYIMSQCNS